MNDPASIPGVQCFCDLSPASPAKGGVEIGAIVARIFDLLDGTCLEPFAAEVAWRLVNGARRQPQH